MAHAADNSDPASDRVRHDGQGWFKGSMRIGERWIRTYCKNLGIIPFSLYEGPDGMTPVFNTYSVWDFWLRDPQNTPRAIYEGLQGDEFAAELTRRLRTVKFAVGETARAIGKQRGRSEPDWSESDVTDEEAETA